MKPNFQVLRVPTDFQHDRLIGSQHPPLAVETWTSLKEGLLQEASF